MKFREPLLVPVNKDNNTGHTSINEYLPIFGELLRFLE
jgi:hypothetical protein